MLLTSASSIVGSWLMGYIIDRITVDLKLSLLILPLVFYAISMIVQQLCSSISTVIYSKLSGKISISLKKRITGDWFQRNGDFLSKIQAGDLMEVLNGDTNVLTDLLTNTFFSTISNIISAITMIIYLCFLQWDLLLIVIALQMIIIPIQTYFGKRVYKKSEICRENHGKVISDSQELLSNILRFVGNGLFPFFNDKYSKSLNDSYESDIGLSKLIVKNSFFANLLSVLIFIIILGISSYKVSIGIMSIGIMVVFIQNSQSLLQPFFELANLKIELEEAKPSLLRIKKYISFSSENQKKYENINIKKISFKNVCFSYNNTHNVLEYINIDFSPGNIYTIEGESGTGKTTLFNLIMKLWEPSSGEILINDKNIKKIDTNNLRSSICYVPKNDFILHMSLYDNITLFVKTVDIKRVKKAMKLALLNEFIDNDRLFEEIGDNGVSLSGGQRQRVALARAFLSTAPVVIMDEPTSALDKKNEKLILSNIKHHMKNKIVIIVSHSENTLETGDVRLKLQNHTIKTLYH